MVVDDEVVGSIGAGLLVLVGVTHDDNRATAQRLAAKLHELRILDGERSIADTHGSLLVVSQFTVYADTTRGRRPSWGRAAPAPLAEPLVAEVVAELQRRGASVATGRFGAHMQVHLVNDGPVTLVVDV